MQAPSKSPVRAAIFKSNRSQAVRLPKSVAFPEAVKEVVVIRVGKGLRILPADAVWDDFLAQPGIDIRIAEDVIDDRPPVSFE